MMNRKFGGILAMAMMAAVYRAPTDGEGNQNAGAENTAPKTEAEIAADNKAAEDAKEVRHTAIKANFNNLVDIKETNFHFRKVVNEIKDPETGKVSKIETKRPTVGIPVPVPSVEGIINILDKGGKGLELLQEAVAAIVLEQAREYINENVGVNEDNFPYARLDWDTIANLPKAERRGGGISKEVWEAFQEDYIATMPAVTGKTVDQVTSAAKVFVLKFAGATTNKPVLKVLEAQLAIYASNTTQGEQFAPCIEFLVNKLDKLINTDETNLLLSL